MRVSGVKGRVGSRGFLGSGLGGGRGGVGVKGRLLKEETTFRERSREDTILGTSWAWRVARSSS